MLRIAFGLIGLTLLAILLVFGVFVGAAMVGAGLLLRGWRHRRAVIAAGSGTLAGKYRLLRKPGLPLLP